METKGSHPDELIFGFSEGRGIGFPEAAVYLKAMRLKRLYRQGWLQAGLPREKCESVADHSFGCAFLALLFSPCSVPTIENGKVALMALVHELGEVYAGDITPNDGIPPEEKERREKESLEKLLAGLTGFDDIKSLWEEYQKGESPEACFVKRIDRLEMAIQAAVYQKEGMSGAEVFKGNTYDTLEGSSLKDILDALKSY